MRFHEEQNTVTLIYKIAAFLENSEHLLKLCKKVISVCKPESDLRNMNIFHHTESHGVQCCHSHKFPKCLSGGASWHNQKASDPHVLGSCRPPQLQGFLPPHAGHSPLPERSPSFSHTGLMPTLSACPFPCPPGLTFLPPAPTFLCWAPKGFTIGRAEKNTFQGPQGLKE